LRDRLLKDRMAVCGERTVALGARATRAESARLAQARRHLDGLARVLDSVSHKSVLERGFALVRGEDGTVRRRASQVKAGEALSLTFTDGEKQAVADGGPSRPKAKKPLDQGSLF
jgi:exodeoxyribonuclease VII large subunit